MITVHGRASSSNVQAVMWGAAELGLEVRRVDCGEGFSSLDTPAFRAMNPTGKIPVLQDGALTLFESAAILRYLARTYGPSSFWPSDPGRQAHVDQWAEWAKQDIANDFTGPIFWRVVRSRAALRDPRAIAEACDHLNLALSVADAQLQRHAFLAGDDLTPGDIHLGHVLYRYFDIDIARPELPALRAYYDRLTSRPAYRTHVMLPYDELRNTI